MCYLCDDNAGEMESCQDCGRLLCFDLSHWDDVLAPAYVTGSGDLYCERCGRRHDQAELEGEELEVDVYEDLDQLEQK